MDHDATREQLELAAVEPGGIDRLVAGDTATAQAVAAHLAGCPDCTDELARLERASRLIGTTLRETPPADLRERTLASVRALGRARGPVPAAAVAGAPAVEPFPAPVVLAPARPDVAATPARTSSGRGRGAALGWVAAIAAAIVLSVTTTSLLVGGRVDQQLAEQSDTIHTLQEVTTATLRVTAEPDAQHVALTGTSDPSLVGSLVFSPSTSDLVVVTTGLAQPPAGHEYRCWVERAGQRQRVGKMFFSGGLAYWIGPVPAVSGLSSDARFGVSLVDASGSAIDTPPVLGGGL
ncbi:MAG: anti-sigma factor domain-containing protein [Candidatus Limnocylindrales bacterium]